MPTSLPPAEAAVAQLANILAACDDDGDEASKAHIAKELFALFLGTSEKLAEAQNLLRKYKDEEDERERVRVAATPIASERVRVATTTIATDL